MNSKFDAYLQPVVWISTRLWTWTSFWYSRVWPSHCDALMNMVVDYRNLWRDHDVTSKGLPKFKTKGKPARIPGRENFCFSCFFLRSETSLFSNCSRSCPEIAFSPKHIHALPSVHMHTHSQTHTERERETETERNKQRERDRKRRWCLTNWQV